MMNDNPTTLKQPSIEGLEDAELKVLPLDQLLPDPMNPRVHTEDNINEIAQSIQTLGFTNPIQVVPTDEPDRYKIVAGHGRYLALQKLGLYVAPCVILKHLQGDDARAMAANIADNEIALHSYYDEEKLATALNELQAMSDALVEASGIDMDRFLDIAYGDAVLSEDSFELNDTTVSSFKKDVNEKHDNAFDSLRDEIITDGEIFNLTQDTGTQNETKHRIMFGDASDASDMEKLMGGSSADLLVTDAPSCNKGEKLESYRARLTEIFGVANTILSDDAGKPFYVLYNSDFTLPTLNAIADAGMYQKQNLVWVINNLLVTGKYDYRIQHENIVFGTGDDGDYNPTMHQDIVYGFSDKKVKSWNNDKRQPSVIQVDTIATTKPIKLVGYFIKNHLKPNQKMLDLQVGNGTGLMACYQTHRVYLGVDNDKDAILTTLCRYAENTHYLQPITNSKGEDLREKLKNLVK